MTNKNWNVELIRERMLEYVKVAEKYYNKDLTTNFPEARINENKRITRNFGMFRFKNGKSQSLELSRYLLNKYNDELIDNVIGHEVAHYIAFELTGKNHNHDNFFKNVCKNISKLGSDINGSAIQKESEKYIREDYIEPEKNIDKNKEVKNPRKARYIQTCPECNYSWHNVYKTARKDSIKKWTQNWYCKKHGHKLVLFDIEEKLKYWSIWNSRTRRWSVNKKKMTIEEVNECNKMLNS